MKSTIIRADELVVGDYMLLKNNNTKFFQVVDLYPSHGYIFVTVETPTTPTTICAEPDDEVVVMDDAT